MSSGKQTIFLSLLSISIPKWYDYESVDLGKKAVLGSFQFQNGTIMRFQWLKKERDNCISIPKWYDYEPFVYILSMIVIFISIPKWYDYELKNKLNNSHDFSFQFQNGTIMSIMIRDIVMMIFNFNSKMVRLWVITCHFGSQFQHLFQFQNGTIMSKIYLVNKKYIADFNSKMVRLWALITEQAQLRLSYFNSKMVRLWVWGGELKILGVIWFQFQNGTIMSHHYLSKRFPLSHFNSKMVRLWEK